MTSVVKKLNDFPENQTNFMQNFLFLQNYHYDQTQYHWQHTSTYRSLSPLRLLTVEDKKDKKTK